MPRGLRKKTKQYVLDRFQEEDPVEYFKYKTKSTYGLTMDQMEIIRAVECQSVQKIRSLLNRGVDPNFMVARTQQTPLHLAVENKGGSEAACEKIVGVLLFFGANPNAQDHDGHSPLHIACMGGNDVSVELLVQAGADVNMVNCIHETPLMSACKFLCEKSDHIIDLLVAHDADVSCSNNMHQTVLHLVSSGSMNKSHSVWTLKERHSLVRNLLKHGIYVNTIDDKGLSPLCYEILLLLKSTETVPWMLSTAKELVCGGAELHLPQDLDELEAFIGRAVNTISLPAADALTRLVDDLQHAIPQGQLKLLHKLAHRTSLSLTASMVGVLDKEIESVPSSISSLTQLSRIILRQCLCGYVYSNVRFLPVPDKIKEYICSCD